MSAIILSPEEAKKWNAGVKRRMSLGEPQAPSARYGVDADHFYVGKRKVKIQFPPSVDHDRVRAILDRHPPSRSSLASVSTALAKVGAAFVPWRGGEPGHWRVYK